MRTTLVATLGMMMCAQVGAASADPPPTELTVDALPALVPGARASLRVTVRGLPAGAPLLLSAHTLGESAELLRTRFMRPDALAGDGSLTFQIPLIARAPGSAELALSLVAYACDPTCREIAREARKRVEVHAGTRDTAAH